MNWLPSYPRRFTRTVTRALGLVVGLHLAPVLAQSEPAAGDGAGNAQAAAPFVGLAQAPEANLFSGSASTAILIDVPPGRKGVTPRLSLTYNSSAGPSPYGHGWDLPIGRIQRSGKYGLLGCSDSAARREFVLSLPSGTVECRLDEGSSGTLPCRPIVEQSFLRIELEVAANRWLAWEKNGTQYVFGDVEASRAGSSTRNHWRDGNTCTYTHTWALTRLVDPNGNHADIAYERVDGVIHPQYVRYGGNLNVGLAHLFEVRFLWQERARGDRPVNALGGHPARLRRLLDRIEVSQPVGAAPLRTYDLTYDIDDGDTPRAARRGFLRSATLFGRGGKALARYDGLPASTVLLYHDIDEAERAFSPRYVAAPQSDDPPALHESVVDASTTSTTVDLRDMNGDGRTDLVDTRGCDASTNPYWRVHLGSQDGFAREPLDWHIVPGDEQRCHLRFTAFFPNSTQTLTETVDINGDGIPDWVDAREQPWEVYLGERPSGSQGWRFSTLLQVPAQAKENGRIITALRVSDGSDDWLELLDWNGDGLVDQVNARAGRVHLGTGSGFDPLGERVAFPSQRLGRNKDSRTSEGLFDVNGDGLLDLVRAADDGDWQIWMREGMRLASARETWSTPASCSRGLRDRRGGDDTWRDFFDINGDGLPDLVDSCSWTPESPYWTVTLGSGDGLRQPSIAWHSFHSRIRRETSGRTRRTEQDIVDMDGDGIVDLVRWEAKYAGELWILHNAAGAWRVGCDGKCLLPSPFEAAADALVRVENGVGGSTELGYVPSTVWDNLNEDGNPGMPFVSWTLARLERDSGMGGIAPGHSSVSSALRYAYGRFDPVAREFLGFGAVQKIDAAGTLETTLFAQDPARKGRVLSHTVHAAQTDPRSDPPLRAVVHDWGCRDANDGGARDCDEPLAADEHVWVRLHGSYVYDFADDGSYRQAWKQYRAWDRYGNVTEVRSGGDDSRRVDTFVDYAYAANADSGGLYLVDRPAHVRVAGGNVEETWYFYDDGAYGTASRGNLTRTEEWVDASVVALQACTANSRSNCTRTRMAYDSQGNVVQVVDAEGRVSTNEYDAAKIYPVRQSNPLGHVVTSLFDLDCGKLLHRSLPDGVIGERNEFDEFCRATAVLLPGQTAATAQRRISYYLGGPGVATDLFRREREPSSPTGWLESDELYDGLGRKLQRQHAAVVDGTRVVLASDSLELEERGLSRATRAPFTIDQSFIAGAARYALPPPGERTHLEYDALARITLTIDASGAERRADHSAPWRSVATGECYGDPSCEGAQTVRLLDAHGNTTEKQAFDERGQTLARTRYTYDAHGRVLTTQQWDGSRWATATRTTTVYDSLGRRVRFDDPDSGLWRFGYDRVGNLIYQDDPEPQQHIELCYDELNRLTQKHVVAGSDDYRGDRCTDNDAAEVEYTYDDSSVAFSTGRLTHVRDRSGATSFAAYDAQGRVLSSTRALHVDGFVERATTAYSYDGGGHLRSVVYPDGERVEYGYDEAGNLRSLHSGGTAYLTDLTYDRFGRPRQVTHGNGPNGIGVIDVRDYHDENQLFRLARMSTVVPGAAAAASCDGAGTVLDLRFTRYTASGKLAQVEDGATGCGGLDATATFGYDALARLVRAASARSGEANYAYDALGNLTAKEGALVTYDPGRPHRPTAAGNVSLAHDRNGNRTVKGGSHYHYDAEDRLIEIDGGAVRLEYDYAGRQVLHHSGEVTRRTFDELSEYRVEGGRSILTKHYFAGDHRLASREVHWQPELGELTAANAQKLLGTSSGGFAEGLVGLLATAVIVGLLRWPDRRRRHLGAVRAGARRSLLVALLFFAGTLPGLPQLAHANGVGSGPSKTKTPRPAGHGTLRLVHYHSDQLGTPLAISDDAGKLVQVLRYDAYGALRDRWQPTTTLPATTAFAFTGYQAEEHSGLQYAGARWYDPQLGTFLSHDPARQFPNPYSYGGGDPINGSDRGGAFFGLDDLLLAVVIGAVAGAAGSGIQAAIQGASIGESLQAAAIGGAIGGAAGYVGAGFIAPALGETVVPALATQLVQAGLHHSTAGTVAQLAVYGGTIGGGLAQAGHSAAKGNYGPLIGIGVAMGLHAALAPPPNPGTSLKLVSTDGRTHSPELGVGDLRAGDVLITDDGGAASATQHAAIVVDADAHMVKVMSADNRGIYVATNVDPTVGGRQWDAYRVIAVDPKQLQHYVAGHDLNGGPSQYFGRGGGNVCSAVVARAVENFGGPVAPRFYLNLVTPAQLRETYGPPIGRVFVPLSKGI